MTSYALVSITTGLVQTFLRPDLPNGYAPPEGYRLVPDDQLPEGWQREPDAPAPVPHEVPMWAIRAILDLAGLTPQINAILGQLPEPQRTIVMRVWEYGNYIRRDSPTITALTVALNKTSAEVDAYFIQAAALNP